MLSLQPKLLDVEAERLTTVVLNIYIYSNNTSFWKLLNNIYLAIGASFCSFLYVCFCLALSDKIELTKITLLLLFFCIQC